MADSDTHQSVLEQILEELRAIRQLMERAEAVTRAMGEPIFTREVSK